VVKGDPSSKAGMHLPGTLTLYPLFSDESEVSVTSSIPSSKKPIPARKTRRYVRNGILREFDWKNIFLSLFISPFLLYVVIMTPVIKIHTFINPQ
jgi:hypothetical protein